MKKLTILTAFLSLAAVAFAQTADDESIKKSIEAQTDAILTRNLQGWKDSWQQDAKVYNTFFSRERNTSALGWDTLSARAERDYMQNPKPNFTQVNENYNIRSSGNMALVDYDMVRKSTTDTDPNIFPYAGALRLHAHQVLVKENDQWKTISRVVTNPGSYRGDPNHTIESDLNNAGYQLIAEKKLDEAIEVFKMNVKFYPNSWNTYDSLGEAYALAGDKKKAIENYEKSMKMNPKSESGPPALAKLKQK